MRYVDVNVWLSISVCPSIRPLFRDLVIALKHLNGNFY